MLSIFWTKIMAAILDFNGSWRLGERKKFLLWGPSTVKNKKKKGGGGGVKILAPPPPLPPPPERETMKYEARNKTLSLERLNYRNATDPVSVFRATGKLHAIPNRGKKIVICIIFSSWPWSSLLLMEIFFSPSRKVLNLRFCPVYITVTSSPSILEWA